MFKTRRFLVLASALLAVVLLQTTSRSQGAAASYDIDPVHSTVIFRIGHVGASYTYGRFNDMSGTIDFAREGDGSSVAIEVKAASVDTNDEKRDNHLRSPDFFSVKEFPTISFKSSSFERRGAKGYKVTGTLSLHGVSKEITADVEYVGEGTGPYGKERLGFEAVIYLKRSDYGMKGMMKFVGNDVKLVIAIEAIKK